MSPLLCVPLNVHQVDAENQGSEDGYPLLLVGLATMAAAAVVLVCVAVLIRYGSLDDIHYKQ